VQVVASVSCSEMVHADKMGPSRCGRKASASPGVDVAWPTPGDGFASAADHKLNHKSYPVGTSPTSVVLEAGDPTPVELAEEFLCW
jgi:hypothetical protein